MSKIFGGPKLFLNGKYNRTRDATNQNNLFLLAYSIVEPKILPTKFSFECRSSSKSPIYKVVISDPLPVVSPGQMSFVKSSVLMLNQ